MLKAYVRRYDGTTQPVTVRHAGQHLGVHDGKVRFARLYWHREEPKNDTEQGAYDVLEESAPLLDTLIVTRVTRNHGERAVFHGVMTEVSADGEQISVMAVDNPATERLYDQPWWNDAPLFPSDQAAPEHTTPFPSAGPQPVQTLGGQSLHLSGNVQPSDPAARPGGHPAAHPAGQLQWQGGPPLPAAQRA